MSDRSNSFRQISHSLRAQLIAMRSFSLLAIFCLLTIHLHSQKKFIAQTFTDSHGYKYEAVTNDPAGLRVYTLKNGLTVYLARDTEAPTVLYQMAVRAGSAYDPADNTGLAHYLEHLLFNGTEKIGSLDWNKERSLLQQVQHLYELHKAEPDADKKNAIYRRIDSISYEASRYGIKGEYRKVVSGLGGVGINGTTNFEYIIYGCIIPGPSLEKLLEIEKDRFAHPSYRAFHTELEIVYEEFNTMQDNDFIQKYFAANQQLFKKHPYGQQKVIGTSEHLKNPSINAINDYFKKYYVPNNMAVILVGNLEFDKTIQMVDKAFGGYQRKELSRPPFPKEDPILQPVQIELSSPHPAAAFIGFRMGGIKSEDGKYLSLINRMLTNGVAGMLDLELVTRQQVKSANSMTFINNDYSMHFLNGTPKNGQSLEDVKDKMLSVMDKIKKGDFEEWLISAAAKSLKREFLTDITENQNLDMACSRVFTQFRTWSDQLNLFEEMEQVTKDQLMAFANRTYQNNYVVVYKKQGQSSNLTKVENPKITPILLNEEKDSRWATAFTKDKPAEVKPSFNDYTKEITHTKISDGLSVVYIPNKKNDIFQLEVIFDAGRSTDKKIQLAVNYINYIGTQLHSNAEWKKQFYKHGLSFAFTAQTTQTFFYIDGLEENVEKGVQLLDHLFEQLVPDQQAYDNYVQNVLNNRKSNLTNRTAIRQAMVSYALYGEESAYRNIYSEQELRSIKPQELTDLIKNLRSHKHRLFYYGKNLPAFMSAVKKHYTVPDVFKEFPPAKNYLVQPTRPVVYLADYEGAQAEVVILARGDKFDIRNVSLSNMFNRFIEKVNWNEIREARSLAYSGWAIHWVSADTVNYNYMEMIGGTQVNKVSEYLKVATSLYKDLSGREAIYAEAKADQMKRHLQDRITGREIFWSAERFKKQGIHYDYRKDIYEHTRKMEFKDMTQFFNSNIAGRDFTIVIVGSKKDMDLNELAKYGEIREVELNKAFNYR